MKDGNFPVNDDENVAKLFALCDKRKDRNIAAKELQLLISELSATVYDIY